MKEYFIAFDYWGVDKNGVSFNKFYFAVINCDLNSTGLNDVVRNMINQIHGEGWATTLEHKVTALNNIEI